MWSVGGSYMAEHGNWPNFSTGFGKISIYFDGLRKTRILSDTKNFEGQIRHQSSNPTDTDIA